MEIREDRQAGVLFLAPFGRVDSNTSGELEKALLLRVDAGERRLVVDLVAIEYISSAGLRVLLRLAKRLHGLGGHLVLCTLADSVREVFELAGLVAIFEIEPSREEAMARLGGAQG